MKILHVMELLNATCWTGEHLLENHVEAGFGCDLMSDVLRFTHGQTLLLTGLVNPHVIRTAEMLDIMAIVFVRGKKPDDDMIKMAQSNNIILLGTEHILYNACGILYSNGLHGVLMDEGSSHHGK